ncbi:MAG TPA: UDP-glucose/GDP-mannose dehydrogenase family protein [Planctomycetota bacterium]|nr:UDP-glucose/GDP-mannose dehydrogenase family protein [Planctomycetota bacterium]
MKVCVIGSGYVGLVTGSCLAEIGHMVTCVDSNEQKIAMLLRGIVPIYEPGLNELVARNVAAGRLAFTGSITDGMAGAKVIFISVGTPPTPSGEADLSFVEAVSTTVAHNMREHTVVAEKSTVPVRTGERIKQTITRNNVNNVEFDVVSNPEFLREGSAIEDFLSPDRIVIGAETERAEAIMRELYEPIIKRNSYEVPVIVTNVNSAELIKHASNSFLALKISYINAVAQVCELSGADIEKVAEGMGLDKRIGRSFLNAGAGFGGSCFPKDVAAFYQISKQLGYDFELLRHVLEINDCQKQMPVKKAKQALWVLKGKTVAVLGLAFKPNTDDIREAPAIHCIRALLAEGAAVKAFDPQAMARAREILPGVQYCADPYDCVQDANAALVMTEWDHFKSLDFPRVKSLMKHPIIIDGRNMYKPEIMREMGFEYHSVGRR